LKPPPGRITTPVPFGFSGKCTLIVGRVTLTTRVMGGASPARGGSASPICRVDSPGASCGQTSSGSPLNAALAQSKARNNESRTMAFLLNGRGGTWQANGLVRQARQCKTYSVRVSFAKGFGHLPGRKPVTPRTRAASGK